MLRDISGHTAGQVRVSKDYQGEIGEEQWSMDGMGQRGMSG